MTIRAQKSRASLASPVQLAVLALLAGTAAAQAQTAAPAAAASASDIALQEVTVTATKRSTSLQSTPLAVTALGANDIEKAHVQTIADIVHLVPSFQATTEGDHGVITMTLRGIGNDSAKTEYADPEVALFVDGIYAPRAEGAAALLFDMEGIEVLRGPQGTLWGRNSTVGAVNMKTAKADTSGNFGNIEGGLGSYNRFGARAAFNLALSDTFAIRAAFVHEQHDGYVDYQKPPVISLADQHAAADPVIAAFNAAHPANPIAFRPLDPNTFVQAGPKYSAQDQSAARLSFVWKPTRDITWNASYEKFIDRGTPNMNLMQTPRAGESFWSALVSVAPVPRPQRQHLPQPRRLEPERLPGAVVHRGVFEVHGLGRLRPVRRRHGADQLHHRRDRAGRPHQLVALQELQPRVQLQSQGKHDIDWILGAYYAAEDNGIRFDIPISNGTQQGTIGWQGSFIQPKETVRSEAVFGQATWNLSDAVHLTGGARFTWDDRKNEGGINWGWDGSNPNQLPIDPGTNPATPGSGFGAGHNDGHYTGTKATWLGRANWDISKNFLAYAASRPATSPAACRTAACTTAPRR